MSRIFSRTSGIGFLDELAEVSGLPSEKNRGDLGRGAEQVGSHSGPLGPYNGRGFGTLRGTSVAEYAPRGRK
jgi:hypothetical protein